MYVLYNIKIWKVVNMHTVTYTVHACTFKCTHTYKHIYLQLVL